MADLGPKKIGSNYHKLLQLDGTIQDGSGSAVSLNISGNITASGNISGSATSTGSFGRIETTTISASTGQFDAGTVYVGSTAMSQNSNGGVTFSDGDGVELGALQGNGYFILSCSTDINASRPLFNMTQQVGTVQNRNLAQIKLSSINFYIDGGAAPGGQWMYGARASGSNYQGDFFLNDNFTLPPEPDGTLQYPAFYVTASNKYWGIGTFPNSTNMMRISGSLFVDGPVAHITASGNISASGTIYASAFSSPGGDGDIDLSNSLDISGNITASGDIWVSGSGDILLDEDQRIYFEKDKQTWIESNGANLIRIVAHNNQMLLLDSQTGNRAVFGNGSKVFIGNNNNALPTETLQVDGNISSSGAISTDSHITASGNISGDKVYAADGVYHSDDDDTYLKFPTGDKFKLKAGDVNFIYAEQIDADINKLIFNDDNTDTDIIFRGAVGSNNNLLRLDASVMRVGIGTGVPTKELTVEGSISASGDLYLDGSVSGSGLTVAGNITASGNISSSGQLYGNILNARTRVKAIGSSLEFSGNSLDFVDGDSLTYLMRASASNAVSLYHSGNKKLETTSGGINVTGHITASDISTNNDITTTYGSINSNFGNINALQGDVYAKHNLSNTHISIYENQFKVKQNSNLFILPPIDYENYNAKVGIGITQPKEKLGIGGNLYVSGSITASGNILSNTLEATGNISASAFGPISSSGHIMTQQGNIITKYYGTDTLVKLHNYNDAGIVSVYQNNTEKITLDGRQGSISSSGHITASTGMFSNLPQSGSKIMSAGELYYATGQQLGLSGSHILSQSRIEASKFVLVA